MDNICGDVRIHVVPTFHHDIAYLKPCGEYLPRCFDIINHALDLMEENDDYHFAIEQVFLWREYWEAFPERRSLMKSLASQGRLTASPGLYAVPDMNMTDGESMFMQAYMGKHWLADNLEMNPNACLIADCWGHHAQIPQIMRQCGYDYYIFMRCIRTDVRGIGENFIWEGLDGTTINTHWLSDGYAGIRFPMAALSPNEDEMSWLGFDLSSLKNIVEKRFELNRNDNMLIPNGGDMQTPQSTAPDAMKYLNENGFDAAFSSFEKYLSSVKWEGKPIVRGEFNTAFQGTFTTNIKIKQFNSRLTSKVLSLESASVSLGKETNDEAIWSVILKGQFHDTICGTLCNKALADTLEEYAAAEQALDQKINALNETGGVVSVINTLGYEKTEAINHNGKIYIIKNLQPMSALPLTEAKELYDSEIKIELPREFKNNYYTAKIGADGYISELIEKTSGRDLASKRKYRDKQIKFGEVFMQIDNGDNWIMFCSPPAQSGIGPNDTNNYPDPYDRDKMDVFSSLTPMPVQINSARVIYDAGDDMLVIEQRGEITYWIIKAQITTTITFSAHEPLIRFKTELLTHGKHVRFRTVFPAAVGLDGKKSRVIHEIPFGWVERGNSEYAVMGYMDYSDDGAGLAVLNKGQPGNCVDEEGNMLLSLHRAVAMEYKTQSDLSFQVGVPQTFEYAALPHGMNTGPSWLCKYSQAYRRPSLLLKIIDPAKMNGFGLDSEDALISSVRQTESGVFVRIYETAGCETHVKINLPNWVNAVAEADGLMRPTAIYKPCSGLFRYTLKPHEIKGWLFK